jgi:hypothetical protein
MGVILLAALLAATAHPASQADSLARAQKWDELYLAFGAAKASDYAPSERTRISKALTRGCRALEAQDAVLAFSLADKAVTLGPSPEALLCLVRTGRRCDQRGSAEKALRQGMKAYPSDGRFALELGRQLLEDQDPEGALEALARVPRHGPIAQEAAGLRARAKKTSREEHAARRQAQAFERAIARREAAPSRSSRVQEPGATDTVSYQSSVGEDGMRQRANRWFILKYFNGSRDFGQRAEYEGRLVEAMEGAHRFAQSILGHAREAPCQVILYTRAEFLTHFGPGMARAVAGLYRENAIRVNGAKELDQETKATLVHEYVHAVVDERAGFHTRNVPTWMNEGLAEYVEWRFQGRDGPALPFRVGLRTQALSHQVPKLAQLSQGPLIAGRDPALLYAESAFAVRMLLEARGPEAYLEFLSALGKGAPFEPTFEATYGRSLSRFQEDLESELARN